MNAWVSIINISNDIKEPTHGYQNCHTTQILIFGGYVKVRESLHTRISVWVNTILYHIDIMVILLTFEGSCMLYIPEWYQEHEYRQIHIPYWP